jgi:endonuclease YncB( thermonuclease family)
VKRFAGIDAAKAALDVFIGSAGGAFSVTNDEAESGSYGVAFARVAYPLTPLRPENQNSGNEMLRQPAPCRANLPSTASLIE